MEELSKYLDRKVMTRMLENKNFAALNMSKGDDTVYKTCQAFAAAHGHTKQSLNYLSNNGAKIDEKGRVFSGSRGTLSFVIKNYRGIE